MKQVLFALILATLAWNFFAPDVPLPAAMTAAATVADEPVTPAEILPAPSQPTTAYSCDGRQYCTQMTSSEEAIFFIQHCPEARMDGDHDGVPCEDDSRF